MSRLYSILAVLAVLGTLTGTAYLKGRSDGKHAEALRAAEAVRELNERLASASREAREREMQRLAEERALQDQIQELRRQANADPDATRPAINADSVRRIDSVR